MSNNLVRIGRDPLAAGLLIVVAVAAVGCGTDDSDPNAAVNTQANAEPAAKVKERALPSEEPPDRADEGQVVLGSSLHEPRGEGFGTAAPHRIYNGGVPSGDVTEVVWQDWGGSVATGSGLTWIYSPKGGYYGEQGEIELRAQSIGRCRQRNGDPLPGLAYTELLARVAKYPGGPLGPWFRWAGARSICEITIY